MQIIYNKKIRDSIKLNKTLFKKGHTPWNKGKKGLQKMSEKEKERRQKIFMGSKNPNWRGGWERRKYRYLHHRLYVIYGRPHKCENLKCDKKLKKFEYAKIKGLKYILKRKNFLQLCVECHRRYDKKRGYKLVII